MLVNRSIFFHFLTILNTEIIIFPPHDIQQKISERGCIPKTPLVLASTTNVYQLNTENINFVYNLLLHIHYYMSIFLTTLTFFFYRKILIFFKCSFISITFFLIPTYRPINELKGKNIICDFSLVFYDILVLKLVMITSNTTILKKYR